MYKLINERFYGNPNKLGEVGDNIKILMINIY